MIYETIVGLQWIILFYFFYVAYQIRNADDNQLHAAPFRGIKHTPPQSNLDTDADTDTDTDTEGDNISDHEWLVIDDTD